MPGYGAGKAKHRIELKEYNGSADWVDIKEGRSSAAATRVQFAGMQIVGVTASGDPILDVRADPLLKMRTALFVESIVAWSLRYDESDAETMPLDAETFTEVLDGDVADWLDKTITTYYKARLIPATEGPNSNGASSRLSKVKVGSLS